MTRTAEVLQFSLPTERHAFKDAYDAVTYTLAGKAKVTLQSRKTGTHFTYRVKQAENRDGTPAMRWFVNVLSGPDNENDFSYIGIIEAKVEGMLFRQTDKARYSADAQCVKAFVYFWRHCDAGDLPPDLIVRHEGTCGRCGRALTVPESIEAGIGPECAAKMGM